MKEELNICEERLLMEPPSQSYVDTEQTVVVDDLAAQTENPQSQIRKRWHSDSLQTYRRSGVDITMPSCFKQDWCFEVCNSTSFKIKGAGLLQKMQDERQRELLEMLSSNGYFQFYGVWVYKRILAKTFYFSNDVQVSVQSEIRSRLCLETEKALSSRKVGTIDVEQGSHTRTAIVSFLGHLHGDL